ncbi:MAG: 30S ribosomal protein S2 [Malacoplasma sp.]|nr:30S ribosomal protein S2 [Malacoplasma sp.]
MPKKAEAKVGSATEKKTVAAKAEKGVKEKKVSEKETTKKETSKKIEKSADKKTEKSTSKSTSEKVDKVEKTEDSVSTGKKSQDYKEKAAEIENSIIQRINANPAMANGKFKKLVSVNKLMETGAHIGLVSKKWNPKMKPYIYAKKGNNYIIDLMQTVIMLNTAYNFLMNLSKEASSNPVYKEQVGPILVVGTRGKVIKNHVKEQARRTHSYYINERWLGGTLTNFKTISNSIKKFNNLVLMHKKGDIEKYNKKERVMLKKKTEKYAKFFSGIRTMKELPKAIILTDPENENIALTEAKKMGIPVVAICNSNANIDGIDYIIPANNYSIKSVYLLVGILCDAIAEGRNLPTQFVGKNDNEIVLPEIIKKKPEFKKVVYHK